MIAVRKLSPGGYAYLTGSVACADRVLQPGESLSDYYLAHGYPPGTWFGAGADFLGVSGAVTAAQMNSLFGEGRHPLADQMQADMIAAGATVAQTMAATKLRYRFTQYDGADELRSRVVAAYKAHNVANGRPIGAPIDADTRAQIREQVQIQAFADAHDGAQPVEGELARWLAEQRREMKSATAGYELVLAPPKSVSIAWALGGPQMRELAERIHRQAVRDTLTYLEINVAYTRKGAGGIAQVDVQGITAAMFEHWDSRSADPHLHTHVPISAKVRGPDGKWTSLDGRTILAASVTMSEFFDSRVRDLWREAGARWSEQPAGGIDLKRPVWELDGVPRELIVGFSRRAAQVELDRAARIVAFRRQHGHEPGPKEMLEISNHAKYDSRPAKQAPRTLPEHIRDWVDQALAMVPTTVLDSLRDRVLGGEPEPLSAVNITELAEDTRLVVSDYHSHFNKWNIEAEAHRQTAHLRVPNGTRDEVIARVVDAVLADPDTVLLQAPSLVDEPSDLRRRDGESVFVEHNSPRWTTRTTLREEASLAASGRRRGGWRISTDAVEKALAGTKLLNDGQRQAITRFARSGRRIQLLYAPAGAGKTTAMRVFAQAWRTGGGQVYAFGPSARAAQVLAKSIGATPYTLHQVTTAVNMGTAEKRFPFARGDVLIVDEVAMAGTHTLHAVVRYALRRGADVRWVGDDKQLAAVEAGGAVRWFAHRNGALWLHEVVRFADRGQGAASLQIREGNADGLDYYFDQGWVAEGSRETIREAAHRNWRHDLDAGRQSLLIMPVNEDVTVLNLEARALRMSRGDVHEGRSAQLHDGTVASAGDWIVTRNNNRLATLFGGKDFVKNGDTWDLITVRRNGSIKVRHQESGGAVVLPAAYVAEHVELAYASTINREQGMTSRGSAHGLVPQGLSREQLYTMSTRAVHDNHLYVETVKHTIDSHQETPAELTARGVLEKVLTRSSAETSATEEMHASLAASESLRTLVGHHDYVAQLGTDDRVEQVLTDQVPDLLDLPAIPALRQTLMTAEDLGWQSEYLLGAALAEGSLDTADDPSAILQWRIAQRVVADKPPERTADPTMADINRWRTLIEQAVPTAAVEEPDWLPVWRCAAGATAAGLDADAAIAAAAANLAARPSYDPMGDRLYTSLALLDALAEQRRDGAGWHPQLPWMSHSDRTVLSDDLDDFLDRITDAISTRVDDLRLTVTSEPPGWTARLGPRPLDDPYTADRWDDLATLGAAYRDTYDITTHDPWLPFGDKPDGLGRHAQAWQELTDQWGPDYTTSQADTAGTGQGAGDRLRAEMDPHDLMVALSEDEAFGVDRGEEPLSVLADRYRKAVQEAARQAFTARAHKALQRHAPETLGTPAQPALLRTLRRAEEAGWRVDDLVSATAKQRTLRDVDDAAAILIWRINRTLKTQTPPARRPVSASTLDIDRPIPVDSVRLRSHEMPPGTGLEHLQAVAVSACEADLGPGPGVVAVYSTAADVAVYFAIAITPDAADSGLDAGELSAQLGRLLGGDGTGGTGLAYGYGNDPAALAAALRTVEHDITRMLTSTQTTTPGSTADPHSGDHATGTRTDQVHTDQPATEGESTPHVVRGTADESADERTQWTTAVEAVRSVWTADADWIIAAEPGSVATLGQRLEEVRRLGYDPETFLREALASSAATILSRPTSAVTSDPTASTSDQQVTTYGPGIPHPATLGSDPAGYAAGWVAAHLHTVDAQSAGAQETILSPEVIDAASDAAADQELDDLLALVDGTRAQAPLPWLDSADPAMAEDQPEWAHRIDQIGQAITGRVAELREDVAADEPAWTAGLGPRPSDPGDAERWDALATAAAAFRETYNITSNDPSLPVGRQPYGNSPRAQAWRQITDQWSGRDTTSPDDNASRTQERIGPDGAPVADLSPDDIDDLVDEAGYLDDTYEIDEEYYPYDDEEDFDEDNELSSGLGL